MAGIERGSVYVELYGTTTTVSGAVPSSASDGQALSGLYAIEVQAQAAAGATLIATGTLAAYVYDPDAQDPDGKALANGGSGVITTAFLAYDARSAAFTVGLTVTGGTSLATGVIAADAAGSAGTLTLTSVTGVFQDNEALTDSSTGAATVNGVAYKTLPYDNTGVAFAIGQVVSGVTSGAVGTISALSSSVLTFPLSSVTGVFVDNEVLSGATQPLWVRLPSADYTVSLSTRAQAFAPFVLSVPRKARMKWVPVIIGISSGSGGVTVKQAGMTNLEMAKQGRAGF